MRKIGFVGAFEKTDLIVYIAKILTELGKRVLVVDTTILQKARYIIPCIAPVKSYVTEYERIDVAVGFEDLDSLTKYIGDIENDYDIVLVDVDTYEKFDSFEMADSEKIYFVTAFDSFSLKKGIEVIGTMREKLKMKKILFSREYMEQDDEYLNLLSMTYPIEWEEEKIFFPYDQGDLTAIIENQRVTKIKLRNLSEEYRASLFMLTQEIVPEIKTGEIKKVFKNL